MRFSTSTHVVCHSVQMTLHQALFIYFCRLLCTQKKGVDVSHNLCGPHISSILKGEVAFVETAYSVKVIIGIRVSSLARYAMCEFVIQISLTWFYKMKMRGLLHAILADSK